MIQLVVLLLTGFVSQIVYSIFYVKLLLIFLIYLLFYIYSIYYYIEFISKNWFLIILLNFNIVSSKKSLNQIVSLIL